MSELTHILEDAAQGDERAAQRLLPLVYDELRKIAAGQLAREAPGQTLQPTALVHEAYLRLVASEMRDSERQWNGRRHFLAAAADAMRHILVDNARRKNRDKRGGGKRPATLPENVAAPPEEPDDLLALDEALKRLEAEDNQAAGLVKLRYFAGLSVEDAAESLGISRAAGYRHWSFARAWLMDDLARDVR